MSLVIELVDKDDFLPNISSSERSEDVVDV